jgi:cobalt-zinc-cadmium efflux system outer membrane protein
VSIRHFTAVVATAVSGLLASPTSVRAQGIRVPDSSLVVQLRETIRRSSPELRARRAELAAAEARVPAAGAVGPAVLSLEVEEVPDGFDLTNAGSARLDLSREVFSGGRGGARRGLASRAAERARLELNLVERSIAARIDGLLVQYLGGLTVTERLAAQDSLLGGAEEALRIRFAVGESRYVDVLRLRTERLRIRSEIAQARTDAFWGRRGLAGLSEPADSTLQRITALLDSVSSTAARTVDLISFPPAPDLDSLVSAAAPVQLAEAGVRQAEAGVKVAAAERKTRVNASVGVQRFSGEDGRHKFGPTLGASLTLPFTATGAGRASRSAARHDLLAARAELDAAVGQTRATLGAARDRYQVAVANAALLEPALLRGARAERENALATYRTGSLSLLELLDFERALTQAEISRTRSQIAAARALAELLAGAAEVPEHAPTAILPGGES